MPKIVEVAGVGNVEFPDSMDDSMIAATLQKQFPHRPSATEQVGTSLKNQAKGLIDMVEAGIPFFGKKKAEEVGQGIVQSHVDQFNKAKEAYDKGDYQTAWHHALGAAIPIIGPFIEQTAEKATTGGRPYEAATDVLAAPILGKVLPKVPAAAGRVVEVAKKPGVAEAAGAVAAGATGHPVVAGGLAFDALRRMLAQSKMGVEAPAAETAVPRTPTALEQFIQTNVLPEPSAPAVAPPPVETPVIPKRKIQWQGPLPEAAPVPVAPTAAVTPAVPIEPYDPMPVRLADAAFKRALTEKKAAPVEAPVAAPAVEPEGPLYTVPDAPIPKAWLNMETTGLQIPQEQHFRTDLSRKVARKLVNEGMRAKDLMDMRKADPAAYKDLLDESVKLISKQAKKGKDYSPSPDTQARIMVEMRKIQPKRKAASAAKLMQQKTVASPEMVERMKSAGVLEDAMKLAEMMK